MIAFFIRQRSYDPNTRALKYRYAIISRTLYKAHVGWEGAGLAEDGVFTPSLIPLVNQNGFGEDNTKF